MSTGAWLVLDSATWLGWFELHNLDLLAWVELGCLRSLVLVGLWALCEFLTRVPATRLSVRPFPFSHIASMPIRLPRNIRWPPPVTQRANDTKFVIKARKNRHCQELLFLVRRLYRSALSLPFDLFPLQSAFLLSPFPSGAGVWWMSSPATMTFTARFTDAGAIKNFRPCAILGLRLGEDAVYTRPGVLRKVISFLYYSFLVHISTLATAI